MARDSEQTFDGFVALKQTRRKAGFRSILCQEVLKGHERIMIRLEQNTRSLAAALALYLLARNSGKVNGNPSAPRRNNADRDDDALS